MVISSKAGWDMWPGPYGIGGSRKYLIASLEQSLKRMGLEYVDIFYSHRPSDDVPLEETMGALAHLVRQGKALYVGISSYGPERTRKAAEILRGEGVPLLIHQPSYSLLNRWVEKGLLETLECAGSRLHRVFAVGARFADGQIFERRTGEFAGPFERELQPGVFDGGKPRARAGTA